VITGFLEQRGRPRSICRVENDRTRFSHATDCIDHETIDRAVPTFSVSKRNLRHLENPDLWRVKGWRNLGFAGNASRRPTSHDTEFAIICLFGLSHLAWLQRLPRRPVMTPYLCFVHLNLDQRRALASLPFFGRDDIVFFSFDLGDLILGSDGEHVLSGVTVPSPVRFAGERLSLDAPRPHLMSFQGDCEKLGWGGSCDARRELEELARRSGELEPRVVYRNTADSDVDTSRNAYNKLLTNSTFSLVIHGHGRWSHRFAESLGAGAIPVVVADGLTLPFEQLIDYGKLTVRIPERAVSSATNIDDVLAFLPSDPAVIKVMQRNASRVADTFFGQRNSVDWLLLAAQRHVEINQR
jgi:hypothetical protein